MHPQKGLLLISLAIFVLFFSVSVLAPGTETTDSCTDTDGYDVTQKGKVYGYDDGVYYKYWDFCNSTTIVEYFCSGNSYDLGVFDCSANYTGCEDGACTTNETSTNCKDSDGGKNYYQKGTATVGSTSLTDHCNDDTLTEKYCSGDEIKAITYECPYGCKEGGCLGVDEEEWEDHEEEVDEEEPGEEEHEEEEKQEEPVTPQPCNGCLHQGSCLDYGTRVEIEKIPHYCDIYKTFEAQKDNSEECMNNYECKSNFCSDNECIDLKGEIEEAKGLLQSILDFFKSLFGFV